MTACRRNPVPVRITLPAWGACWMGCNTSQNPRLNAYMQRKSICSSIYLHAQCRYHGLFTTDIQRHIQGMLEQAAHATLSLVDLRLAKFQRCRVALPMTFVDAGCQVKCSFRNLHRLSFNASLRNVREGRPCDSLIECAAWYGEDKLPAAVLPSRACGIWAKQKTGRIPLKASPTTL